jgi:SAM-dependent methyltransferase
MDQPTPAAWVRRFAPLIRPDGRVLDLAAGAGRHTRLLIDMGFRVTAIDRDTAGLRAFAGARCEIRAVDLETGAAESAMAPLGSDYDGIVVTNYLHRPLFASIAAALAPNGVLTTRISCCGPASSSKPSPR